MSDKIAYNHTRNAPSIAPYGKGKAAVDQALFVLCDCLLRPFATRALDHRGVLHRVRACERGRDIGFESKHAGREDCLLPWIECHVAVFLKQRSVRTTRGCYTDGTDGHTSQ